jgi:hypothetical protein
MQEASCVRTVVVPGRSDHDQVDVSVMREEGGLLRGVGQRLTGLWMKTEGGYRRLDLLVSRDVDPEQLFGGQGLDVDVMDRDVAVVGAGVVEEDARQPA